MFASPHTAGSNRSAGHERMLFGSLGGGYSYICSCSDTSVSVITGFHLQAEEMGAYIITLSCITLNVSHLVLLLFFILMKTSAIAAPHLFYNQNNRNKLPCRDCGPPQYLMK